MPAACAASIPGTASSTTTHRFGGTPMRSAAFRKMSGAGFPCSTSRPHTSVWNQREASSSSTATRKFSGGPLVPTANNHPASCNRASSSRPPAIAGKDSATKPRYSASFSSAYRAASLTLGGVLPSSRQYRSTIRSLRIPKLRTNSSRGRFTPC